MAYSNKKAGLVAIVSENTNTNTIPVVSTVEILEEQLKAKDELLKKTADYYSKEILNAKQKFNEKIDYLNKKIEILNTELKNSVDITSIKNLVVVDGKEYKVVYRNVCKEFLMDYHRRLFPEDYTAIVIDKHGGWSYSLLCRVKIIIIKTNKRIFFLKNILIK